MMATNEVKLADYESRRDGIVYLFAFPRSITKQCPNLSPFAVKLETWMRINKIKYEVSPWKVNLN